MNYLHTDGFMIQTYECVKTVSSVWIGRAVGCASSQWATTSRAEGFDRSTLAKTILDHTEITTLELHIPFFLFPHTYW